MVVHYLLILWSRISLRLCCGGLAKMDLEVREILKVVLRKNPPGSHVHDVGDRDPSKPGPGHCGSPGGMGPDALFLMFSGWQDLASLSQPVMVDLAAQVCGTLNEMKRNFPCPLISPSSQCTNLGLWLGNGFSWLERTPSDWTGSPSPRRSWGLDSWLKSGPGGWQLLLVPSCGGSGIPWSQLPLHPKASSTKNAVSIDISLKVAKGSKGDFADLSKSKASPKWKGPIWVLSTKMFCSQQ